MSPEQIRLVQTTLASLTPLELDALAAGFYARLFAADPSLMGLFSRHPGTQRQRFAHELSVIVGVILRFDEFVAEGCALGSRHRAYGVVASHYRTAADALLGALAATLGPSWTSEAAQAWRLAYHLTAEVMVAGSFNVVEG